MLEKCPHCEAELVALNGNRWIVLGGVHVVTISCYDCGAVIGVVNDPQS